MTARSVLRAISALVALLIIVLGVPLALLTVGRLDVIRTIDWSGVLSAPDDGRLLLAALTILGWLAWAAVAVTVAFEVISLLTSGRIRLRLPGAGWFRPAVAALVVAVGALALAPNSQPARLVHTTSVTDATPDAVVPARDTAGQPRHVVQSGDDLWSLAQRYLGDGAQWRRIAAENPMLNPADRLQPGSALLLPADADLVGERLGADQQHVELPSEASTDQLPKAVPTPQPSIVTVQKGDTLWALAETHLGDPLRWSEIFELNRDQIANPDQIDSGWQLRLPIVSPAPVPVEESTSTETGLTQEPATPVPESPVDVLVIQAKVSPVNPAQRGPQGGSSATSAPETAQPAATNEATDPGALAVAGIGGTLALGLMGMLRSQRIRQLWQRGLGRRISPPSTAAQRFEAALGNLAVSADDPGSQAEAAVMLGWQDEQPLFVDLEANRVTHLVCTDPEVRVGALAAVSSSLFCADWSDAVTQVAIACTESWTISADDPKCSVIEEISAGIAAIEAAVSNRLTSLGDSSLTQLRNDPDTGGSWSPIVFLFGSPLLPQQRRHVVELLAGPPVGVSAVLASPTASVSGCVVDYDEDGTGATYRQQSFVPQLVGAPARRALIELVSAATTATTEPAWWWSPEDLPPNVTRLRIPVGVSEEPEMDLSPGSIRTPTALLLGPVQLLGAQGELPPRAVQQCIEYCAWILANPGSTASVMTADLLVAETTRRSNMSRLRTWLGKSPTGELYLPEAYSGRIQLHPDVTSDWELFTTTLLGGVNRASMITLQRALSLVRGAPFADSPPWPWAEQWRLDMISAIRDAGVTLARQALEVGDTELARWAIARASAAAPNDELLTAALVQVEHRSDNGEEVKRLVFQLTRNARATGIDLGDETVSILQEVLEGRRRARSV